MLLSIVSTILSRKFVLIEHACPRTEVKYTNEISA